MAHNAKYTRGAMGHMLAHYDRTHGSSTSKINEDLTYLNYNLAAEQQSLNQLEFIHKRLGEVKLQNRKDVNVLCDWIVTAPKELTEQEHSLFFKETFHFLQKRYGAENTVSAYVHMDETTPHMHYAFIPVTKDKKKGRYKVSAKEVITLKDLQTFHPQLSAHLNEVFGRDIGILNGETSLGNQTVQQLREGEQIKKEHQEQLKQLSEEITNKKIESDALKLNLQALQAKEEHYNEILHTENQSPLYGTLAPLSGKFGLEKKYLLTESEINSHNQFCNEQLEAIAVKEKELEYNAKQLSIREEHLTKLTFEKLDELSKREQKIEKKEKDSDFLHNRTVNRAIEMDEREQKLTDKEEAIQRYELERQEFYRERFPYVNKLMEDKKKALDESKSYKNLYEEQTNKTSELLILNKKILSETDEAKKFLRKKEQEEKEDKSKISVLNDTVSKLKKKLIVLFQKKPSIQLI